MVFSVHELSEIDKVKTRKAVGIAYRNLHMSEIKYFGACIEWVALIAKYRKWGGNGASAYKSCLRQQVSPQIVVACLFALSLVSSCPVFDMNAPSPGVGKGRTHSRKLHEKSRRNYLTGS